MRDIKGLPNVSGQIQDHIAAKIKTWGGGLYASMIGDPCEKYLYHSIVDWRLQKPRAPEIQSLFELGTHLEILAKQRLREIGYEVFDHGDTLDAHGIRGKMDCFISGSAKRLNAPKGELLKNVPVEIKWLASYGDKFETIWDLLNSDKRWVRRYPGQLLFYMYARNSEIGLFLSFNKPTGWPTHIWVDLYEPGLLEIMEGLIQKAERIHAAVRMKVPPPHIDSREGWCFDCDYIHVCNPPAYFGEEAKIFEDSVVVGLLDLYFELQPKSSEFKKVGDELKKRLNGIPSGVCGPYIISGKNIEKKGFEVKESSYWSWKAKKIEGLAENVEKDF